MAKRNGVIRRQSGVSIIESVLGIVFIVLLILFFIDVGAVITCQTNNERMCKNAVRAASEKATQSEARQAADEIVQNTKTSQIFTSPTMEEFNYDTASGMVTARTMATCNLPVPVPGTDLASVQMQAKSVETIVAILAD